MARFPFSSEQPAGTASGGGARLPGLPAGARQPCTALAPFAVLTHYELFLDPVCKLFMARRTAARFERIDEIRSCFSDVEQLLTRIERRAHALLVDVRAGPGRNDSAFEAAIEENRGKLLLGFARNAALFATPTGRLHIQRYAKADGRQVFLSDDPRAIFANLALPHHEI
ncbi:MAG TPA: hypothetical protein VJV79_00370 [Polyangiaceae bacterium]|nr:hypothetical protein [Polyangiaceae bacterium]